MSFTVKDLKALIADLPETAPVEIFNSGYEWYGVETIVPDQIRSIDGRVVIHFGGAWSEADAYMGKDNEVSEYRKKRGADV